MDLKRIKTIMIIILLLINVFFAYNLVREYRDEYYIDNETIENAVQILSRSGIKIDREIIPDKKLHSPVYEGLFAEDHKEKVAALISGTDIESAYSTPDGMRFVAKNGSIVEISDALDIAFWAPAADRYTVFSSIISDALRNSEKIDEIEVVEAIKSTLSDGVVDGDGHVEMTCECTGVFFDPKTGYHVVRFEQMIDGAYIYGHKLFFVVNGNEPIYMEGNWTFVSTDNKYSSQMIDQINILFMEKKAVDQKNKELSGGIVPDHTVNSIDVVYCTYFNDDKTGIYFIPALRITYDDMHESVYDMQSGIPYSEIG